MTAASEDAVGVLRTPNGGIQPRASVDGQGIIHLIYFKSAGAGGNLSYVTRQPGSTEWSEPMRVNMAEGSVVANGAIGVAQIALGRQGRVHVYLVRHAWPEVLVYTYA